MFFNCWKTKSEKKLHPETGINWNSLLVPWELESFTYPMSIRLHLELWHEVQRKMQNTIILIIFPRQCFIHISGLFQFAMKFNHLYSFLNAKLIGTKNFWPIFFCYFFFFNLSHVILDNHLRRIWNSGYCISPDAYLLSAYLILKRSCTENGIWLRKESICNSAKSTSFIICIALLLHPN